IGCCTIVTLKPRCTRISDALRQPDPSASAPWTMTMFLTSAARAENAMMLVVKMTARIEMVCRIMRFTPVVVDGFDEKDSVSAEGEGVRFDTWVEEADLKCPFLHVA